MSAETPGPVPPPPEGRAETSAKAVDAAPKAPDAAPQPVAEPAAAGSPAAKPRYAAAPPPGPPRKWKLPEKSGTNSNRLGWLLVIVTTTVVVVFGLFLFIMEAVRTEVDSGPVTLGPAYRNQEYNFRIRPPINWTLDEHYPDTQVAIHGPAEHGLTPLVLVATEIAPGRLETYLAEYKLRCEHEDKTLKWTSEDDTWIDGCHAERLEYDSESEIVEGKPKVKVHVLQYIFDCKPRFYRITCYVSADLYWKYRAKFEACVGSFVREAIPQAKPQFLSE
ncbi:MAG: hypothetical protein HY291_15200 [Planctomycetes bacterium]|nr:hypothetical protein [Planctomycetota bacterium]